MNRDDFIDFLSRLVADGLIAEDKALDLLAQFDAGALPDGWDLPLSTPHAIRHQSADHTKELALVALLLLLRGRGLTPPMVNHLPVALADKVQGLFESEATRLAGQLATRQITLTGWHAAMLDAIETHITQQMMLGAGVQQLSTAQQSQLNATMLEQSAFLQRFADHIAAAQGLGHPFSEDYITNRAQAYGGAGRGAFFAGAVESLTGRLGGGWVIDYVSVDSPTTCAPCSEAALNGPYEPNGDYPKPGTICLGAGRCRCSLRFRYAPDERVN